MKRSLFEPTRTATTTRLRAGATLLGLCALGAACALVVSACGSSPSAAAGTTSTTSTTSTSTTTTAPTSATSFTAYQKCLVAHGVTGGFGGFHRGVGGASGPVGGASGFTRPKLTAAETKALAACASLAPKGGFSRGGFGGRGGSFNGTAFAKYRSCMTAHGATFGPGVSRTSSKYLKAESACASDRPAGFGNFAGASGGGGGGSNPAAYAKTQACLKSHGINPADPGASTSAQMSTAFAACKSVGASATTTTTGT